MKSPDCILLRLDFVLDFVLEAYDVNFELLCDDPLVLWLFYDFYFLSAIEESPPNASPATELNIIDSA